MQGQLNIDLTGVPQTLLFPLIARANFSKQNHSPIRDEVSLKLANAINYDFDYLLSTSYMRRTSLFMIARAYHFDVAIQNFLKQHPSAIIVNLGAGLDTTFQRIDNGQLTWVNIDLPEVIEIRQKLLNESNTREHNIAKSVHDFTWMDDIKKFGNDFLFIAGGLFLYFTPDEVKSLVTHTASKFPNSELVFDNISPSGIKKANKYLIKMKMHGAKMQWCIRDGRTLENWTPHIKLIKQTPSFDMMKSTFKFPLLHKSFMYFSDLIHKSGIIHCKFI